MTGISSIYLTCIQVTLFQSEIITHYPIQLGKHTHDDATLLGTYMLTY